MLVSRVSTGGAVRTADSVSAIVKNAHRRRRLPIWLWEARAVMMLNFERFAIAMPLRTVQDHLYRWNFRVYSVFRQPGCEYAA